VERTRIGTGSDASSDTCVCPEKREFVSLMNKLVHANKVKLVHKLESIMVKDNNAIYVPIIWDMMLRCADLQTVYIDVVHILRDHSEASVSEFDAIWHDYINMRKWIPEKDIIIENENYDEFCEFVKWKKRAVATIHAIVLMSQKGIITSDPSWS
jgi:hypothetical protein